MLAKKNRLSAAEIEYAKTNGLKRNSNNFTLLYSQTELDPKFAIVVSKKVSKKAVDRNKIKRIVREAIKANINKLKGNYLIIARPNVLNLENEQIVKEITTLLK